MAVNWIELAKFEIARQTVSAPWLLVLETVEEMTRLQIKAEGSWKAINGLSVMCGPDGLQGLSIAPDQLVISGCRVGALIAKLGGSSATLNVGTQPPQGQSPDTVAGQPFAVGSHCLASIPQKTYGPLFIGFNTLSRPIEVDTLRVGVLGATLA